MKRCSRCVLPETYAGIEFDANNVCSVCRIVERRHREHKVTDYWDKKEKEFRAILEKHKTLAENQGNIYDCIVPFSGGKDSTYTLYTLIRKYNMKPLVVTFNHTFLTDIVRENRRTVLNRLGADIITFRPNWQVVKKLMLKSFKLTGDFCWHCHCGIYAYPMQIAVKYRIPLLVWGSVDYALDDFQGLRDWKWFTKFINLGLNPEDMVGDGITLRDLEIYRYPSEKELKELNVLGLNQDDYMFVNVRQRVEFIKKELGWKESPRIEGSFVTFDKVECKYIAVRDYIKFIRRGYGRTAQLTSVDIRDGLMTRDEALKLIEEFDGKRPHCLTEFLEDIGITDEEFLEIADGHKVPVPD